MSRTYASAIEAQRKALRRGIPVCVYALAALFIIPILGEDFFWLRLWLHIPWGIVFLVKLGLALVVLLLARLAIIPIYEMAAVPDVTKYLHLEAHEAELIAFFEGAEAWYRQLSISVLGPGTNGPRLLTRLPEVLTGIAAAVVVQGGDDLLKREKEILAAISARRPFISDKRSCMLAAAYYFRYLKKPQHLDYDWDFRAEGPLGEFLYQYHTWETNVLHMVKRHRDLHQEPAKALLDDPISVLKAACYDAMKVGLAAQELEEEVDRKVEQELARREGNPAAQDAIRTFRRQMKADIQTMAKRARIELIRGNER